MRVPDLLWGKRFSPPTRSNALHTITLALQPVGSPPFASFRMRPCSMARAIARFEPGFCIRHADLQGSSIATAAGEPVALASPAARAGSEQPARGNDHRGT